MRGVQVRPARAAGLVCQTTRPYVCLSLSPFAIWDDDPHTLLHGMMFLLSCSRCFGVQCCVVTILVRVWRDLLPQAVVGRIAARV